MQSLNLRRIRNAAILIVIAVLLLAAQSAFWLNHTIFNKQAFTSIVTPIVNSTETRSAIAATVVDRAFADRPLVNRLIGNDVTALVTGLLGTDIAVQTTTTLIDRSYNYLTTDNPQPIALDLVAIKGPLERITELLEARGRDVKIDPSTIPDTIVFFEPSDLPDIYQYSVFMLWFGPLCWIGLMLFTALYIYFGRNEYARRIYTLGGVVIAISCIGLLVGPLLPPPISAQVPIPELRGTVDALISGLLAPFTRQMIIAITFASLVLIIFYFRFSIARGAQRLTQKAVDALPSTNSQPTKTSKKEASKIALLLFFCNITCAF